MLELDENKPLNGIFKDEDFVETEDDFSVEEELDSALTEIAGLKESLSATVKSDPVPHTRDSYKRTEARSVDYPVQPEYHSQRVSNDAIYRLMEEVTAIKGAVSAMAKNSSSADVEALKIGISKAEGAFYDLKNKVENATTKNADNDPFATSVIHQLVKIKKLIGSDNVAEVQLNNELNELYLLEQKATRYVENDNIAFEKKFSAIDDLIQRLKEAYNYDVSPLIVKVNALLQKIATKPLTKESLSALESYLNKSKENGISVDYVKELDSYLTLVEKALLTTAEQALSMLDDIVSRKNAICLKKKPETENLRQEYVKNCNALQTEKDKDSVTFLRNKTNAILKEITKLNIGDVYAFDKVEIQKDFRVLKQPSNKSIYETILELKNIVASGGILSADDAKTGIASDISYIKEKLDIMQSERAPIVVPTPSENGSGAVVTAGMLTLESVVGQLDRLFDDIKNVVDALEVNVMDNLAIINDNVNIIKESVDKSVERITALEESESEIHEIKEIVSYRYEEDNSSTNSSAIASQLEKQNELIATMLDGMQKMQQRLDEMNESISSLKSENAELKKTVEKIFESTDENASSFESIKNVIAELKEDVEAIEENVSDSDDDLDVILDKIDEAIADKNE